MTDNFPEKKLKDLKRVRVNSESLYRKFRETYVQLDQVLIDRFLEGRKSCKHIGYTISRGVTKCNHRNGMCTLFYCHRLKLEDN